jgi:putative peptidoglycan lipid II flippase
MTDNQQITETQRRFSKHLGAFSSATLLSRILGYIRDALVAAYFGGGMVTDAFYAAFKIPNLLRRFFGEGSMTAAFIPIFSDVLAKKGEKEAVRFFHALLSALFLILTTIIALGIFFAPEVARMVAWGFANDPQKMQLTVDLVQLTFPFLLIISFAALVSAVLNAHSRFFIPAISPSGLSIGEIAFICFFAAHMDSPVHGLAVSAVIGVGIHFLWQLPALYKEGYSLKWANPFGHPDVKRVFLLMGPTVMGLSADQINSFVYAINNLSIEIARATAFSLIVLLQMAFILLMRRHHTLWSNKYLLYSIALVTLSQALIVTIPVLRKLFGL